MAIGRGPPGLGGEVSGGYAGFGHVGEARACYDTMARVMRRLTEIKDNVEADSMNVEKCVKETTTIIDMIKATGRMLEQDHLRMISMVTANHKDKYPAFMVAEPRSVN